MVNLVKKGVQKESSKKEKSNSGAKILVAVSIAILVIGVLVVLSIQKGWINIPNQKNDTKTTQTTQKGDFAAKVNDETISYQTLDKQYDLFFTLTGYPEQYKEVITKDKYLSQLIVESLLLQEAAKNGMTLEAVQNEEVKQVVDNYLTQLQTSQEEFVTNLIEKGLTIDEVITYFKRQIVMMNFLNSTILGNITITDEMVKKYYEDNKADFTATEGQIRARHILVNTSEEAEDIIKQLKNGTDFAELAKEKSMDPGSAIRGGDLGFFTKDQMIKEFSDAAFALENEVDISEPVKTIYGYHIIQKESDAVSQKEAEEGIKLVLLADQQRTALQSYLEELKTKSTIELNATQ